LSEYGTTISKFYEEHYYHKLGEEWEIFLDIALPPNIYKVKYGNKEYDDVSAYVLLKNFGKNKICVEIYNKLNLIRELNGDIVSRKPEYKKSYNQKP
jgi:hypothetical protein